MNCFKWVMLMPTLLGGACFTPSTPPVATIVDAGSAVSDAGVRVDAGASSAADAGSDAGASPDLAVDAGVVDGARDAGKAASTTNAKATPFDRVLVKPKDAQQDADGVKRSAQQCTGAHVSMLRRSARTWWLLEFAPTAPPRTAIDQQRIIDALQASGAFLFVEGDRLMKVK